MISVETVIAKLHTLKAEYAEAALENPRGKDAFDYGQACGIHMGFRLALEAIASLLDEAQKREKEEG